jgi:alanine racemase
MLSALSGLPPGEEAACVAAGIDPVLCSLDDIARWRAHAGRLGRPLPALLHIDTGMSRLGLDGGEFRALREDPGRLDGIALRYVMTHLAAADDPADPLNRAQLARFTAACSALPPAPRSLANSSGIFLGPDWGSDLARPGGALYGLNPTPADDNPMRQTARLRARVVQVREIGSGEGVGYGATWRAARPSRIATVGVGYADGYPRALSNRGWACFDGATVPLVGRVSMDLTTFDATGMPTLRAGDWLELLGPGATADALGAAAGSNGYEILTSLGGRITRSWRG